MENGGNEIAWKSLQIQIYSFIFQNDQKIKDSINSKKLKSIHTYYTLMLYHFAPLVNE